VRKFLLYNFLLFFILSGVNANKSVDSLVKIEPASCRIEIISGNKQFTREGNPFEIPLQVKLTDNAQHPLKNITIEFKLINPTDNNTPIVLERSKIKSDSSGIASVRITKTTADGMYEIMAACPDFTYCPPQFFILHVRRSNWVTLLIIGLVGGLGLFLLGMNMMSEGLQNAAGNRMRIILSKLTNNRFIALGLGALVTIIVQSSSATTVMLVSFVNSKLMRFKQTIGIIFGAAIGTTITVQIIAFQVTEYALLFVAIGILFQWLPKKPQTKELGKTILGFGMLFYGMYIMSESMSPLRTYDPFVQLILRLEHPALGIIIGALITALIQSSSAFIGILIILSMQGLLTLGIAIPLLIGANLGTSITAIIASLSGSREGKQVALAHTIYKLVGAGIIVFFIPSFTKMVLSITHSSALSIYQGSQCIAQPRQIANAHTIYNIVLCLLFLPFTNGLGRFIEWIFPLKFVEVEKPFRLRFIDQGLLVAPSLALNAARLELLRMMRKVHIMTEKIILPFIDRNQKILADIDNSEKEINYLRDQINDYLIKITQNSVSPESADEAYNLMNAVREFEQIADIVSRPLRDKAESWCQSSYEFSVQGKAELKLYHQHTLGIIIQAISVYENPTLEEARKLKLSYAKYREEFFNMEQQHYDRLRNNVESTVQSSKTHLEVITLLKVISSHATNTSRILIYRTNLRRKQAKNGPGKSTD
jgi:phosphate:Na+ symporter